VEDEVDGRGLRQSWDALAVPDVDGAWADLRRRLADAPDEGAAGPPAGAGPARSGVGRWRASWGRAAAVVALLLGVGTVAWSVPVTVAAPVGEQRTVQLPDGSRAQLNAGTVLRYPRGFAWLPGLSRRARSVRLDGEAWFQVAFDGRPFRVAAGDASVTVLGTAFTVRRRAGSDAPLRVVVEEGRVAVQAPGSAPVEVRQGEAVRWTPGGPLATTEASPRHAFAWRTGGFAAHDAPLGEVLVEAERRFGVTIEVAQEVPVDERVTVYYGSGVELERILGDLVTARGLHFRPTATGWQVVP
jgi:transmembrane sensor